MKGYYLRVGEWMSLLWRLETSEKNGCNRMMQRVYRTQCLQAMPARGCAVVQITGYLLELTACNNNQRAASLMR